MMKINVNWPRKGTYQQGSHHRGVRERGYKDGGTKKAQKMTLYMQNDPTTFVLLQPEVTFKLSFLCKVAIPF